MRPSSLAIAALLAVPLDPAAQEPARPLAPPAETAPPTTPAPRGVRTHDGFFLQMNLGAGAMSSTTTSSGDKWEFSGAASQLGIAVGYAVVENFIIAGDLWLASVTDPSVKAGGSSLGATDNAQTLYGLGLNFTYYFMPLGMYVTVVPSAWGLDVRAFGLTHHTAPGFAFRAAIGKEWWVSDNWGLGLNLQYAHSANRDKNFVDRPTWRTDWFGVAFSATYN